MTCNYNNSDPTQGNFHVNILGQLDPSRTIVIRNLELVCSQSVPEAQFHPSTITKRLFLSSNFSFGLTFVPFPMWHATLSRFVGSEESLGM